MQGAAFMDRHAHMMSAQYQKRPHSGVSQTQCLLMPLRCSCCWTGGLNTFLVWRKLSRQTSCYLTCVLCSVCKQLLFPPGLCFVGNRPDVWSALVHPRRSLMSTCSFPGKISMVVKNTFHIHDKITFQVRPTTRTCDMCSSRPFSSTEFWRVFAFFLWVVLLMLSWDTCN